MLRVIPDQTKGESPLPSAPERADEKAFAAKAGGEGEPVAPQKLGLKRKSWEEPTVRRVRTAPRLDAPVIVIEEPADGGEALEPQFHHYSPGRLSPEVKGDLRNPLPAHIGDESDESMNLPGMRKNLEAPSESGSETSSNDQVSGA